MLWSVSDRAVSGDQDLPVSPQWASKTNLHVKVGAPYNKASGRSIIFRNLNGSEEN